MKNSNYALLLLVFLFGVPWARGGEKRDVEGNFKIKFPGSRDCEAKTTEVLAGVETLSVRTFAVQGDKGLAYMLSYVDYPDFVLLKKQPRDLLAAAGSTAVSRLGGVRLETVNINKPETGQLIKFKGKGKDGDYAGQLCQIFVEKRLYQMLVLGPQEAFDRHAATDFFNSFELLSKPK